MRSIHPLKTFTLIFISSAFFFTSCVDDPFSSLEVYSAKNIRPVITMERTMNDATGNTSSTIKVKLLDLENNPLKIDGGKVTVNDIKMKDPRSYSNNTDYYFLNTSIAADSFFTFRIFLTDGDFYEAWIESPDIKFNYIEAPSEQKRKTKLDIKWNERDYRYPQKLLIQYYNSDSGFKTQKSIELSSPYLGAYTINKKHIKYTDNSETRLKEMRIKLVAQTDGALDNQFHYGGSATCTFNIFQDIEVY